MTSPLLAQTALYVIQGDTAQLVREVHHSVPLIMENGEMAPVNADRYLLQKTIGYPPVMVAVRNFAVGGSQIQTGLGNTLNGQFHFTGEFESIGRLERVFVVLEFREEGKDPILFVWGVGTLEPHVPQSVDALLPLKLNLTGRRTKLHVYSDGREVLHSQLPAAEREYMLDQMVAERIKDTADEPPSVLVALPAAYPKDLPGPKRDGKAVLEIRIGPTGAVLETTVKSATEPAFGVAASEAVARWRFLPCIRQSERVEAKVTMPVIFRADPAAAGTHSGISG